MVDSSSMTWRTPAVPARTYDDESTINVGTGIDVTIRELAELIREIVYRRPNYNSMPPSPTAPP